MKNKLLIFGIALFLLIGIILLVYFGVFQSIISGYPIQKRIEYWGTSDSNINLESVYFGGYTSGVGLTGVGDRTPDMCGNDDGKSSLNNNYIIDSNSFVLSSSFSAVKAGCDGNYIQSKVLLPKGTLSIRCKLSVFPGIYTYATSSCKIEDFEQILSAQADRRGNYLVGSVWQSSPPVFDKTFVIEIKESKEITAIIKTGASEGSANAEMTLTFVKYIEPIIIPVPTKPNPPSFVGIINSVLDWIKNLFSKIFVQQSIVGATTIEPNTLQTYQIDISTTTPDSNWEDGNYSIQYSNWALVDSSGNIKNQGTWEEVNGRYQKSIQITTPSNIGDYILLSVITQYDMNYNFVSKTWTTSEEKIMNKEAINLQNKYTVIAPTKPTPSGFAKFWSSIMDFFRNLFGIK